ncbi:xanthine dehydrogenase accessory protein XdhC [bacterium]|nr:xanthine dehydrogenase accessory protein XdhC [bacterium]
MKEQNIFSVMADLIEANKQCALVLITRTKGSTPRKAGSKMIVFPDGEILGTIGGGSLEHTIIDKARKSMHEAGSQQINLELEADLDIDCGGQVEIFIETFGHKPRLLIFGAGHIGQKLAPLALDIGFQVLVIDERAEINCSERFPQQINRQVMGPLDFIKTFTFSASDHIVIITHNHVHDHDILSEIITCDLAYIGMIGSTNKISHSFERLRQQGVQESQLERVHAPIGLKIRAETPSEIATLIAAELIQTRYA